MEKLTTFILILICSLSPLTRAYDYPTKELDSPRSSMNYFLKSMKGFKLGDQRGLDLAIHSFNMSELETSSRIESAKLAAKRLIQTLDRIELIDIKSIPVNPKTKRWVYKKKSVILDNKSYQVEISIAKNTENEWLFTPETISTIEYFERATSHKIAAEGIIELSDWTIKIRRFLPAWTGQKSIGLLNGQWLGLLALVLFSFIIERIFRLYVGRFAKNYLNKREVPLNDKKKNKITAPAGYMVFSGLWIIGIGFLELPDNVLSLLLRFGYVAFTVSSVVATHMFVDVVSLYLTKVAKESENTFDDILVPLVSKTAKFFVFAIGFVFIGNSLTIDMKSIVAGLGIGGIAFALAAKDTLSNLFGSLTVLIDRPFSIGDWVVIGKDIEGTVEEVGLRSTRVRTFYDSLITVPNGQLTNIQIDNFGRRKFRRYNTKIGVQYDTPPEKLEAFCEAIRQIILSHKWTRKDYFHVYFNGFNNSSLDILVYLFWEVPSWSAELQEKHRLLMDILRVGNEMNIEFAFPTQTIHMHNESSNEVDQEVFNTERASIMAQDIAKNSLSTPGHKSGLDSPGYNK